MKFLCSRCNNFVAQKNIKRYGGLPTCPCRYPQGCVCLFVVVFVVDHFTDVVNEFRKDGFWLWFYLQSLTTVGGMFGGLFAFPISELLGRQATLMLGGVPFLTGWVLIANAIQITQNRAGFLGVLFTGRFLTGFATGWSVFSASVSIYLFES